ncbi:hypothetical protein BRD17_07835 [Halobacteriales archaeon SW_7_68_16]|nr:MAG: hypothetical protein BRD17_07835 [Halobacteriales archaeon SW_7_68_16]
MFGTRSIPEDLDALREAVAPESIVLDADRDFETLPPMAVEDLGLVVDDLDPVSYPAAWFPDDVPETVRRRATGDLTLGLPGDGSVVWTGQTDPPVVVVKPRTAGSPTDFVDFLIAEALVAVGGPVPEDPLAFFTDGYADLAAAVPFGPAETYRLAAALYDGYCNLNARPTFREWGDEYGRLGAAWTDAGDRFTERVDGLPAALARGRTTIPEATEIACSALKHDIDVPAPFDALDTGIYGDRGAPFAVEWARRVTDAA